MYSIIFGNPLKIFFVITWSWIHKNNAISKNWSIQPAHIVNLTVNTLNDMRYYSVLSNIFQQDTIVDNQRKSKKRNCLEDRWNPPKKG